ncbi:MULTISPECIES: FhaA domain-containing protein [unclassified Streptomyces]|uniref:FhaA domain-containing protein n=1 Tax=unclassified Streptomyces TaxID=2593676 RepID=UPI00093F0997|nr:FhaA domain-containing protein [Streptomyces sp. TSRI0281]
MHFLGTAERLMERCTTPLWDLMRPPRQRHGEVLAILHRRVDDGALILGRQRVVVPNAFVIEVLPEIHRQLTAHALPVEPCLVNEVHRYAAEQGYTFAGRVAVALRPAPDEETVRFRIHSRIAPAAGQHHALARRRR